MKPAMEGQTIPASAFMIFQAMFAAITPGKCENDYPAELKKKKKTNIYGLSLALAFGSAAERMSVSANSLFLFSHHMTNLSDLIMCIQLGPAILFIFVWTTLVYGKLKAFFLL
jgi:Amt family ammonium transporter